MKMMVLFFAASLIGQAFAYEAQVKKGQMAPDLATLLQKANSETGITFNPADFLLIETRELATSKFTMFVQTNSMVPVAKTAVRIWSDLKTNELILGELHLDEATQANKEKLKAKFKRAKFTPGAMKSKQLSVAISLFVEKVIASHPTDSIITSMKSSDQWENGDLVRVIKAKGRRGVHNIAFSLFKNTVIRSEYMEFPQSESVSVKAHVFPIYEEVEATGERLPYELKELRHLDSHVHVGGNDPLGGLRNLKFPETRYYPLLAQTPVGQMNGLWSESSIRKKVDALVAGLPLRANNFESGILLQGKYTTINLHPDVKEKFKGVDFELTSTTHHMLSWVNNNGEWEAKPVSGLNGKAITSQDELLNRIPFRHPEHDTTSYINSGFDEIQVYYGVTVLMESLVEMGFNDPELSEKPFHAFLYDPDLAMRDNAYYYDNTINFTTYNPGSPNMARDNPTIWHEMGHAIMERIMGEHLGFAGTTGGYGGLSEGMADFVAQIVVEHQTSGAAFPGKNEFRIINDTGFYLTNEFHDEGEAYGGAMNDMFMNVISDEGQAGLHAFTDLTLEAMRFTRNHPALTAAGWFEHMLFADEIGSAVRAPGKYKDTILDALVARNFSFSKEFSPAKMTVMFNKLELTSDSPASRGNPLTPCAKDGVVSYDLNVSLDAGDADFIKFPAIVKVEYKKGALQGAINWVGEESNPHVYKIQSAADVLTVPVKANSTCDSINQPDGSCRDYAYLQIFNEDSLKPIAKKRFYLNLNPANCKE